MADKTMPIFVPSEKPVKVSKWKVKHGAFVSQGQILFLYNDSSGKSGDLKKFKATRAGTISSIKVKEGDIAEPGDPIAELEECRHSTVMKEMCAECGADLRVDEAVNRDVAVVPMVHSVPELKVSEELAQKLGREDAGRLLRDRKLVLLVDLDQTLVHTTNENVPPNLKDVLHFFLRCPGSPGRWCHTRLRPRTKEFLESASKNYELHVCTFGARQYAHAIADLLDPEKKFFSHRILSRDECFDPRTKSANLKALFPCGDHMVCIIDDREDVWRHAANLIHVRPYSFFQNTGDINAPPPPVDEKPKLPSGKNGSQPVLNQMPTLDAEPDAKKEKQNDKSTDGGNGLVINNDTKITEISDVKSEKIDIGANDMKVDRIVKNYINAADNKMDIESDGDVKTAMKSIGDEKIETKVGDEQTDIIAAGDVKTDTKVAADETTDTKAVGDVKIDTKTVGDINSDSKTAGDVKIDTKTVGDINSDSKTAVDVKVDTKAVGDINSDSKTAGDVKKATDEDKINDNEPRWTETPDKQIEVEDPDDYLIYLEDILKRIHQHFYDIYDKMGKKQIPDLKCVIPEVKSEVLAGTSLVFSGLVPTHQKLETSRAFLVAKSLGAEVTQDYTDKTTHLVAVRAGTAKVNASRRQAEGKATKFQVVTPDWLWTCAERWERVDERLYPLQRGGQSSSRRPPAHCSSPPAAPPPVAVAATRRRTPSGRFMDTLNPLLSFSSDDIADMDREVEDIFNESDESSSEEESKNAGDDLDDEENPPEDRLMSVEAEDSSQDRLLDTLETVGSSDSEDEGSRPRKRPRPSSPPSDEEPPDDDDSSWNLMGAALERELEAQD